MPPDPFTTRLMLLTGKGGVGKTTVVAALAAEAARRGKQPLIVELGHRASMAAVFGVDAVGHAPVEVAPGVFATNIDFDEALRDYVAEQVPIQRLAHRITRSRSLARFFEAAPAVREVLTLHRLEALLADRWDPVIVDLDSTGHALMFLELPRVFEGLVPDGPIRRLLDSFASLLGDHATTTLHLVTLPTMLPVQETAELFDTLRQHHAIRLGCLFVNRIPALPPVSVEAIQSCRANGSQNSDEELELSLLERAVVRHRRAVEQLATLETSVSLPLIELPDLEGSATWLSELGQLVGGQR